MTKLPERFKFKIPNDRIEYEAVLIAENYPRYEVSWNEMSNPAIYEGDSLANCIEKYDWTITSVINKTISFTYLDKTYEIPKDKASEFLLHFAEFHRYTNMAFEMQNLALKEGEWLDTFKAL